MSIIYVPDECKLNFDDLEVALGFFQEGIGNIILQVPFVEDIVEVKRFLVKKLGTPDNNLGSTFSYSSGSIQIMVLGQIDFEPMFAVFYISYKDNKDLELLEASGNGITKSELNYDGQPLWKSFLALNWITGVTTDELRLWGLY